MTDKQLPFISVVIPLYNKAAHINRTISSVINQTFEDFELVIVDDGSTDNGAEIAMKTRDKRIRVISQKNMGRSVARNNGILSANSEFVALLDADDEWESNHIATLANLIEKYPEAGAWGTAYDSIGVDGNLLKGIFLGFPSTPCEGLIPRYFYSAAIGQDPLCSSSIALSKSALKATGMFPIDYSVGEDVYLFGKIALRYPIAFSWNGRAIYHQDATNRTNVKWNGHPFVKVLSEEISKCNADSLLKQDLIAYKCKLESLFAGNLILHGEKRLARKILKGITPPSSNEYRTLKLNYYFWIFLSYLPKWFCERYAMSFRGWLMGFFQRKG